MSKRAKQAAACGNKRRYATAREARQVLHAVVRKSPDCGFLKVYACGFCSGFHYGHARGRALFRQSRLLGKIDAALARDAVLRSG